MINRSVIVKDKGLRIKDSSGFTLIEVLVVIGILTILGSLGLLVSFDFYKSYAFNSERDTLVSMLQKARSQSLANICLGAGCADGLPHGVHIDSSGYVVFQGNSYNPADPLNQTVAAYPGITNNGPIDVIFSQLSGDASYTNPIKLTYGYRQANINVNSEGQINW